jgi:hypothetical protein
MREIQLRNPMPDKIAELKQEIASLKGQVDEMREQLHRVIIALRQDERAIALLRQHVSNLPSAADAEIRKLLELR